MRYVSTRANSPSVTASRAIELGLAPDGGLYIPEHWPPPLVDLARSPDLGEYPDFANRVLQPFFSEDPLQLDLAKICARAFSFPLPLKMLDPSTALLELFHGPTSAFKDFGARFLALCTQAIPSIATSPGSRTPLVLVATSGDTGGAVAAAFRECTTILVVVLYPDQRISQRQEKQLTTWGPQVLAIAVQGSFDDCQRLVKEAMMSEAWKNKFNLLSANSINLARLLPQMTYFAYASTQYFQLRNRRAGFIVPSGNLGNAVAALWAQRLGFPIAHVVLAHNANRPVVDYFASGKWQPHASLSTLANAMDVGNPSNFERLSALGQFAHIRTLASAQTIDDQTICKTIVRVKHDFGEVICPHTAAAFAARQNQSTGDWIIVATAHPSKFEQTVEKLIGEQIAIPAGLQAILNQSSASIQISPTLIELQAAVAKGSGTFL